MILFYGLGFIALFVFFIMPGSKVAMWLFVFAGVLDAGHGYITAFRSFYHSNRSFQKKAMAALVLVFLISTLLFYFHVPYLWTCLIYFTFYHHLKQNIGITKIYGRLVGLKNTLEEHCAKILIVASFIIMHTRPNLELNIFGSDDFFFFPLPVSSKPMVYFMLILTIIYLGRVSYLLMLNRTQLSYYLSLAVPVTVNVICFLFGENVFQVVGPLLLYHALIYIVITSEVMKTKNTFKFGPKFIFAMVIFAAIGFGVFETILSEQVDGFDYLNYHGVSLFILAMINAPAVWHYIIDGFIWKRNDQDFSQYMRTF